jgi:hypothetical protein
LGRDPVGTASGYFKENEPDLSWCFSFGVARNCDLIAALGHGHGPTGGDIFKNVRQSGESAERNEDEPET